MKATAGPHFDEVYAAHFADLTVQLYAYFGDQQEAQDVVQEAFCRALDRWRSVSGYDDPVAWVRRVAWNLAVSRWRRTRTALNFVRRQPLREAQTDGPTPERVALVAALADGQTVASRRLLAATYILQMACSGPGRVAAVLHGATSSDGRAIGLCDLGGDVSQSFLVPADATVSVELRPADGAQDQAGVAVRLMMMADDATGLANAAKDRLPPARGTTVAVSGSFLSTATSTVDDTIAPGDYRLEFACAGAGTVRITLHYGGSGADTSEVASCGNGGRAVELSFARPAGEPLTTVLAPDAAAAGQSAFAARVERAS